MQKTIIASYLVEELERANKIHGAKFASPHEGYAVMKEELDELWDEIKKQHPDNDRLRDEAIQVGAMAIKFIESLENWSWLGLKMSASELKCLRCRYCVLTAEERTEIGDDPCETCSSDLCNWKAR